MSAVGFPAGQYYRLSGHALLRYGSAHLVDLATAALQIQEDLAASHMIESEEEARGILGGFIRFRPGYRYLAGASGIYVVQKNMAITYIDSCKKFRSRAVRGATQWGRAGRLKTSAGRARRDKKVPV